MPRWLAIALAVLVVILIGAAITAPLGPVPGFRLGGTETPPPEDWSSVNLPETVQFETTGGLLPRVVNIWIVEHDATLWVIGDPASGWVQQASANADVGLRIGGAAYRLKASRVAEPAAYAAYLDRYRADNAELIATLPPPDASEGVAIIRLDRP